MPAKRSRRLVDRHETRPVAIHLRPPTAAELHLRAAWLADPATMAYNAGLPAAPGYDPATGCLDFPPERRAAWLDAWTSRPDHVVAFLHDDAAPSPLGEVAFRVTPDGDAHIHVLVAAPHSGRGVGAAALRLLLARAFSRPDVARAVDVFPPDRARAEALFRRLGFVREGPRVVLTRAAYHDVRVQPGTDVVATARIPDVHYARTRAFYAALGFEEGAERDDVWPGNPCLTMTRRLGPAAASKPEP